MYGGSLVLRPNTLSPLTFARSTVYNGPGMITLALDTTTATGSVAIRREGRSLAERSGSAQIPHGRRLPGDILHMLDAAGVSLSDVALYAVASGPGAFTGLRIGIATIQGLAFANRRPVLGISALEALAHASTQDAAAFGAMRIAAWMDAARGEVFTSLFAVDTNGALECLEEPAVEAPVAALSRWAPATANQLVFFAGEGALRYSDDIRNALGTRARVNARAPALASTIGELGEAAASRGLGGAPHALRPLYVRRPDAVLARERTRAEASTR